MEKTRLSKEEIQIIRREIEKLREEKHMLNPVLRNDVFTLLESQKNTTVLYYPLEDKIEGFRIRKFVNGKDEEFVYINTANPEDIQIFTGAHELGHLMNIDVVVCDELGMQNVTKKHREDIIDRFAAELLMDERSFTSMFDLKIGAFLSEDGIVSGENMMKVIVFLMDYFMVPYISVVHRLHETRIIADVTRDYLLDETKVSRSYIDRVIEDGNFKRLKPTGIKAFGELAKYLEILSDAGEISENRAQKIMKIFDIKEFDDIPEIEDIKLEKGTEDE